MLARLSFGCSIQARDSDGHDRRHALPVTSGEKLRNPSRSGDDEGWSGMGRRASAPAGMMRIRAEKAGYRRQTQPARLPATRRRARLTRPGSGSRARRGRSGASRSNERSRAGGNLTPVTKDTTGMRITAIKKAAVLSTAAELGT